MTDDLKPGQKYPTPTPGFGDRVFYETLLKQRPDSAMAQEWCVNYGVLSHKQAAKLVEIIAERKRQQRLGSSGAAGGMKSPPKKKKKSSVIKEEIIDDPDFQVSAGSSMGLGQVTL